MDKPISMSVKDYLIRKMAVKIMMSEKLIESVINHQFQSANQALQENNSVEISGFGKFYFNKKKAERRMDKLLSKKAFFENQLENNELSEQKKISVTNKLNSTILSIEALKPKLNIDVVEPVADLRRMEE